jgi:CubicO group peptidase (beta-lactamase class C family)
MHAGWRDVTLQQLLAHRSGLPASLGAPFLGKLRASQLALPEQRQRWVGEALRAAPDYTPGTKHVYSNLGFVTAGAMLEMISGQSWEALMQERLFKPLGITTAGFGTPGVRGKIEEPWGHRADGEPSQGDNPLAIGPAGAAHMALRDWAKFVALHLRGDPLNPHRATKLLSPETFAWLHTPHDEGNYVAGWVRETHPTAGAAIWHNGSNTFWYAIMYIAPEKDMAVLIAANRAGPAVRQACDRAARVWLKEYTPSLEKP